MTVVPDRRKGVLLDAKAVTVPNIRAAGSFSVDLPLSSATLNERLYDIGLWLVERQISHLTRIQWQPLQGRIRVSFAAAVDASDFRKRFGAPLQ